MCVRGAPSLVLNWAMVVDQLAKHTPLQHRLDNSVNRVAEVVHNAQRIVKHRLQPLSSGIQSWMEGFNVDSLARIKQR